MKIVDLFLKEDLLITRPSIYIYIDKDKCNDLLNKGLLFEKDYIPCYLKRLPEDSVQLHSFMTNVNPVRITLFKLRRIKDQKVKLICKNISGIDNNEIKLNEEHLITKLQVKYSSYLDTCYKDHVPLENLPRIDLYLEKHFLPGFVCKVLKV